MRILSLSIAIIGVITRVSLALPAITNDVDPLVPINGKEIPSDEIDRIDDGSGCQVFKAPNLGGGVVVPRDTAFIPGIDYCTDLSKIFGGWDEKIRSFQTHPGYKCKFFTKYNCPETDKVPDLEVGKKDKYVVVNQLPEEWDGHIHSVICWKI